MAPKARKNPKANKKTHWASDKSAQDSARSPNGARMCTLVRAHEESGAVWTSNAPANQADPVLQCMSDCPTGTVVRRNYTAYTSLLVLRIRSAFSDQDEPPRTPFGSRRLL
mmetsp:Transcript_44108/g.94570  ORF Transcript_44108/g.94570 Transcript_44108/m.94570 type:complete len:111 (-) Transcript_44108:30-362(-)